MMIHCTQNLDFNDFRITLDFCSSSRWAVRGGKPQKHMYLLTQNAYIQYNVILSYARFLVHWQGPGRAQFLLDVSTRSWWKFGQTDQPTKGPTACASDKSAFG